MRLAVLGMGNVLRRDDGFGPTVARRLLSRWSFPDDVAVEDVGTPGLDLVSRLVGVDVVVAVDAVEGGGPAGALTTWRWHEMPAAPPGEPRVTAHEADLRDALAAATLHGEAPREAYLVGAVAHDTGDGVGLTSRVDAALEPACRAVLSILASHSVRATARDGADDDGAWWHRRAAAG